MKPFYKTQKQNKIDFKFAILIIRFICIKNTANVRIGKVCVRLKSLVDVKQRDMIYEVNFGEKVNCKHTIQLGKALFLPNELNTLTGVFKHPINGWKSQARRLYLACDFIRLFILIPLLVTQPR